MTMKKIISIALVLVLALSLLTACGGKDNNSTPSGNSGGNNGGGSTTTPSDTTIPPTSQNDGNDTTPSNNDGTSSGASVEWPDNDYTKDFPKPNKGTIESAEEVNLGGVYFKIIMNWTLDEAKEYAEQLKAAGFECYLVEDDEDFYIFTASSSDHRRGLTINYSVLGSDVSTNIAFTKK
jgi:ABC-type glycerol-3-phosphate transport system substrate-binding protein